MRVCEVLRKRSELGPDAVIFLQGGKEANVYDTETWSNSFLLV